MPRSGLPLIAGHPGETEKEFTELSKFISEFRFDRLGVFSYSNEEGTYASENYVDDVPGIVKQSRVAELMKLQQSISNEMNFEKKGSVIKMIIDRREGDFFVGRTQHDSPEVDQEVFVSKEYRLYPGNFYNIRITETTEYDLIGVPAGTKSIKS